MAGHRKNVLPFVVCTVEEKTACGRWGGGEKKKEVRSTHFHLIKKRLVGAR